MRNSSSCAFAFLLGSFVCLFSLDLADAKQFNPNTFQENIASCDIPLYQNASNAWEPSDDMCPNDNVEGSLLESQNEAALHSLAVAHAPFLFFHPLENFTMSSVNRTMGEPSQGKVFLNDFTGLTEFDDQLTQESLIRSTRDFDYVLRSGNFFFQHTLTEDYVNGDGFDENGISNAPIYYRAFDSGNGTITINYYMYYTFNGPSNLGILSSINGTEQYIRFMLPPWQTHEGGWKTMGVTLCNSITASPQQPLALTYRQQTFTQRLDCAQDECTFFGNSNTHPVGFVALNSHFVHPFSAVELIYSEAPIEFWVNLQGILLVERTAYADANGENQRYFEPTVDNVIRLPEQVDIPENTDQDFWWAAFGGAWGGNLEPTSDLVSEEPLCLTNDTMQYTDCPDREENYVFVAVMETLGVYPATTTFTSAASLVAGFLNDMFAASTASPPSPAALGIYNQLDGTRNAPIWDTLEETDTGTAYCRRLVDEIPDTTRLPYDGEIIPLVKNVIGVIVLGVVMVIAAIVYFCCLKVKRTRPFLLKDDEGHYLQPKMSTRLWMFRTVTILTVAYSVCLCGAILFFIGYDKLINLLESTFPFLDFASVKSIFFLLCVFVTIINSAVLIMAWFRADDLWNLLNEVYFDMVNDKEGIQAFMRRQWMKYTHEKVHAAFLVCFGFLLMSLLFSIFMVIIGIFSVGFAYAFGYACDELAQSLDGVCLSFEAFGMREIQCGADFEQFCKQWAQTEIVLTLWGAFIVVFGHFFLISAGGMILTQERETKRAIALLPNQEEYAEGFRVATNSRNFSERMDESKRQLMVDKSHELALSENDVDDPRCPQNEVPANGEYYPVVEVDDPPQDQRPPQRTPTTNNMLTTSRQQASSLQTFNTTLLVCTALLSITAVAGYIPQHIAKRSLWIHRNGCSWRPSMDYLCTPLGLGSGEESEKFDRPIGNLDSQLGDVISKIKKVDSLLGEVKVKIKKAESEIDEVKGKIKEAESEIDEVKGKIKEAESEIGKVEGKIEKMEGKIEKVEDQIEKVEMQIVKSNSEKKKEQLRDEKKGLRDKENYWRKEENYWRKEANYWRKEKIQFMKEENYWRKEQNKRIGDWNDLSKQKILLLQEKQNLELLKEGYSNLNSRIATITFKMEEEVLQKDETTRFAARVWELFQWHTNKGTRSRLLAPYFSVVQSSGSGKTKMMGLFRNGTSISNSNGGSIGTTSQLSPEAEGKGGYSDPEADATIIYLLCYRKRSIEPSGSEPSLDGVFDGLLPVPYFTTDIDRTKLLEVLDKMAMDADTKRVVFLLDEAQHLLHNSWHFRCIRWWLRQHSPDHGKQVVAVFAGTTLQLANKHEEAPISRTSRTISAYYDSGSELYPPFYQLYTTGLYKWKRGYKMPLGATEFEKSVVYGRPLFAGMLEESRKDFWNAQPSILRKLLISSPEDWPDDRRAKASILGTRLQLGDTSLQIASELVEKGYATLTCYNEAGNYAHIAYLPDPVLARLAMCFMIPEYAGFEIPNSCKYIANCNNRSWSGYMADLFSNAICRADTGDVGEIGVALYLLLCGDRLRYASDPQLETLSIPLDHFLEFAMDPVIEDFNTLHASDDSDITLNFIQVTREHLSFRNVAQGFPMSDWYLRSLYESARGAYAVESRPVFDLLVPLRFKDKSVNESGEQSDIFEHVPMLVSVKNKYKLSANQATRALVDMRQLMDELRDDKKGIAVLVVVGLNASQWKSTFSKSLLNATGISGISYDNQLEKQRMQLTKECKGDFIIVIPEDDPFGVSQSLRCCAVNEGEGAVHQSALDIKTSAFKFLEKEFQGKEGLLWYEDAGRSKSQETVLRLIEEVNNRTSSFE